VKIKLDENTNYIVSGLERSGTSLMMQILKSSKIPIAYDDSRKSDKNNPRGYFELEHGKIIDSLKNKTFPMEKYKGKFIKVTSWGLQYLPKGKYNIIYMIRNIDEIIDSTEKMTNKKMASYEKDELRNCLVAFDKKCLRWLELHHSKDLSYIVIFYNALLNKVTREDELGVLASRYGNYDIVKKGKNVIDVKLYRNRNTNGKN